MLAGSTTCVSARRTLMLQENHGMGVLEKAGISVPAYGVGRTSVEAYEHAKRIGVLCFLTRKFSLEI
jgi:acyl-CoA synthetase (NDP forming)